jgi:hypothetical protein
MTNRTAEQRMRYAKKYYQIYYQMMVVTGTHKVYCKCMGISVYTL